MIILYYAVGSICISGIISALLYRFPRMSTAFGVSGTVIGSCIGCVLSVQTVMTGVSRTATIAWNLPFGECSILIDPLSAFFLLPIFGISALAAVYGSRYLLNNTSEYSKIGMSWFLYTILVSSMIGVVIASDAVFFLLCWELMALSSFLLVLHNHEKAESRQAAWLYFVASHIGTLCIIIAFLVEMSLSGSTSFGSFAANTWSPVLKSMLFILFFIGFGTKAGIIPFHIWLPYAHPAAPTHVSALMSGVMIKVGIYGIVRSMLFFPIPQQWWSIVLVCAGIITGVGGILFALGQTDLKKLLAYSSVENSGVILCGLGLGYVGASYHIPPIAFFGFAGALFHILNHSLFKSLLFFGAGAIHQATHTLEMNQLGGLYTTMRKTGTLFLLGAISICALPLGNGFMSELLLFLSIFQGIIHESLTIQMLCIVSLLGVGFIGGTAVACFTNVFGTVFLGERRKQHVGKDPGNRMLIPMAVCALCCIGIGIGFVYVFPLIHFPLMMLCGLTKETLATLTIHTVQLFYTLCGILLAFAGSLIGFIILRKFLLRKKSIRFSGTWDCGYTLPQSSMQYTATSFAQPITEFFAHILKPRSHVQKTSEYFPQRWSFRTSFSDPFFEILFQPLYHLIEAIASQFRRIQSGNVRFYILYIAITLIVLILWKLGWNH